MKTFMFLLLGLSLGLGCARVRVEAPKEPIKVDVSMRLDIYQHIEKDIDKIENMVSGPEEKPKPADKQSLLEFFIRDAYADEELSPEVQQAASRRKDRRAELVSWQEKGVIGENRSGLVQIRMPEKANSTAEALVAAENNDRMVIYQEVAKKNGSSIAEVQRLYAKRLQADAPTGTPIEIQNAAGTYEWQIK